MKKPELSIIIPMYNARDSIEACIESLLTQRDFGLCEAIVINDGSDDGCEKIVEKYAQAHSNIKLINQENVGVSAARNIGMSKARGKNIMFLDSDDIIGIKYKSVAHYFPNPRNRNEIDMMSGSYIFTDDQIPTYAVDTKYLYNMLYTARNTDSDIVMGGKVTLDDTKNELSQLVYTRDTQYTASPRDKSIIMTQADLRESANFAVYNRKFLANYKLTFKYGMQLDEDMLFCMLAVFYANKVSAISDSAYLYLRHADSLSNISGRTAREQKYTIADIQRYSVLLQHIAKRPAYAAEYTKWLKTFSYHGEHAKYRQKNFPPNFCWTCPRDKCRDCPTAKYIKQLTENNISMFFANTR